MRTTTKRQPLLYECFIIILSPPQKRIATRSFQSMYTKYGMTRKSHRKSRTGCLNCKQRRIKCDEEKPSCRRCITRDEKCSYPSPTDLVWVDRRSSSIKKSDELKSGDSPPSYESTSHKNAFPEAKKLEDPSLNLDNIALIIHWFTTTVHTVNPPAAIEVCQTVILKEAMQHHFLLHGLLALSALHLADSHADPQLYMQIATSHHTRGLRLYHSILSSINKTNHSATIAFSSLTFIFAMGISRPQISKATGLGLLDDLIQAFQLSSGWRKVVQAADDLELFEPSANINAPRTPSASSVSPDVETAFGRLHALNQNEDAATYTLAISGLKSVFAMLEGTVNDNPHLALAWVDSMPEKFISLIRERQTMALVILAHYCVVLHRAPRVWWLRGWSEGLFGVIWRGIDPAYRESLNWPRQQIGFAV